MALIRFLDLPPAAALTGDEVVPVTQGTADKQTTVQDIVNLATGGGGFVPYYIPEDTSFVIPEFMQALFYKPIVVDGSLVIEGTLFDVGRDWIQPI